MSPRSSEDLIAATRPQIALTGTLQARIGGVDVAAGLPGRQGRALFAFLVVNRHRPVGRHELIGVLWPDEPPDAPEAGLSTVLARMRRALGDGVVTGRTELCFALDAEVDTEQAVAAAETAERALAGGDPHSAMTAAQTALDISVGLSWRGSRAIGSTACVPSSSSSSRGCSRCSPVPPSSSAIASTSRPPSASPVRWPSATPSGSPVTRC